MPMEGAATHKSLREAWKIQTSRTPPLSALLTMEA